MTIQRSYLLKGVDRLAEEKKFETKLLAWLATKGIYRLPTPIQRMNAPPIGYYIKRWGGGTFTASGLPDSQIVIGCHCIECELKASNGRPSQLQVRILDQINKSGGDAWLLYPADFDKFKSHIEEIITNVK